MALFEQHSRCPIDRADLQYLPNLLDWLDTAPADGSAAIVRLSVRLQDDVLLQTPSAETCSLAIMNSAPGGSLRLDADLVAAACSCLHALNLGWSPLRWIRELAVELVRVDGVWRCVGSSLQACLRRAPTLDSLPEPAMLHAAVLRLLDSEADVSLAGLGDDLAALGARDALAAACDACLDWLARAAAAPEPPLLDMQWPLLGLGDLALCLFRMPGALAAAAAASVRSRAARVLPDVARLARVASAALVDTFCADAAYESGEAAAVRFLGPLLLAANGLELGDIDACLAASAAGAGGAQGGLRCWQLAADAVAVARTGVRIGLSSANASDNWTQAKQRGGRVLNVAVTLDGVQPVCARAWLAPREAHGEAGDVWLRTTDPAGSGRAIAALYRCDRAADVAALCDWSDARDPLRFLKYALVFAGVLPAAPPGGALTCGDVRRALDAFMPPPAAAGAWRLCVDVASAGPVRSGLASSSAVAMALLAALLATTDTSVDAVWRDAIALGTLAMRFENALGLKTGRQDVDGLLPGVKHLRYGPTRGLLVPAMPCVVGFADEAAAARIARHVHVVDTAIPRATRLDWRRGLNARHLALLRRHGPPFAALLASLGAHDALVRAYLAGDLAALGRSMTHYMALRQTIDAGATCSVYDDEDGAAGEAGRVLLHLFRPLVAAGIISGGMFTGAMGGGVALLVTTDDDAIAALDRALAALPAWEPPHAPGVRPFAGLRRLRVALDARGLHVDFERQAAQA